MWAGVEPGTGSGNWGSMRPPRSHSSQSLTSPWPLACLHGPTDEKGKFDELVEEKGVRILIEPTAIMHLLGTRMNYVEDKLK